MQCPKCASQTSLWKWVRETAPVSCVLQFMRLLHHVGQSIRVD